METTVTPKRIGEIYQQNMKAPMAKQSKYEECGDCGETRQLGLFKLCSICHGRKLYDGLPDNEKQNLIRSVIPARYMKAETKHFNQQFILGVMDLDFDQGLYLWGSTGVGKTYLMAGLIKVYMEAGYLCKRINYEMLCLNIRDTFKSTSRKTEFEVIEPYLVADKLFIEDVGTTKSEGNQESDFSVRTFFVILDFRLENNLPTYITTNRPLEELARTFDARIASRIKQGCKIIKLKGEDKRK